MEGIKENKRSRRNSNNQKLEDIKEEDELENQEEQQDYYEEQRQEEDNEEENKEENKEEETEEESELEEDNKRKRVMTAPILIKPSTFYGDETQDPVKWIMEYEKAARANQWKNDEAKRNYMEVYLKGDAEQW